MKKLVLLVLMVLAATASLAQARVWQTAAVIGTSVTNVSGPLVRSSTTMHYTVETEDLVLELDYSFHPTAKAPAPGKHNKNSEPGLAVNTVTKIAIAGRHAYILDNAGSEVKMHIVKKTKK